MVLTFYRLIFGIGWLIFGVTLLLRDVIGVNLLPNAVDDRNLNLVAAVSVAFGIWQVVRWYTKRLRDQYRRNEEVLRKAREARENSQELTYHPEFDFEKGSEQ